MGAILSHVRLGSSHATDSRRRRSLFQTMACLAAVSSIGVASYQGAARAAQTTATISMAAPPAAPRIQGPTVVAGKPGAAFLFTIPATGQGPLSFSATGLPTGLTINADTGIITGVMPPAGTSSVAVKVVGSMGTAQETLTINSANTLSPTPPLGWNSYDSFGGGVKEAEVVAAAKAMKAQLQPYGYHYVVVDYLWFDSEQNTDSNGRYLPSPGRFPSATGTLGFKPLADQIHAMGLGFGIHIMRGIPRKTFSANSPIANSTYRANAAGNSSDACPWDDHMWGVRGNTAEGQAWYDSLFAQYATWEIDFVKVDDLLNNQVTPNVYHQAEVDAIRKAIDKTGRSIVLSLSPGPMLTSSVSNLNSNANMWRMVNDFWDTESSSLGKLSDVFSASGAWQGVNGITLGHWPDADMLPLGYLGPRVPVHGAGPTGLSHNQQITVMTLWGILPSPLMFGGNVPALTTDSTGPWTVALLGNEEVMAVNQDALGSRAKRLSVQGNIEIWSKELSGGAKAVALFNRGTQDAMVTATFAQLGVTGTPTVRDLWHRMDVTGMTTGISVNVPYSSALMYKVAPPLSGTGGSGGGGGGSGAGGGASGTGGSRDGGMDASSDAAVGSGSGGFNGSGGSSGSGGANGSGGDGTGNGSGGSTNSSGGSVGATGGGGSTATGSGGTTAGTPGTGGTTGGASGGSSGGCQCGVGNAGSSTDASALIGLLMAAMIWVRRRNDAA